MRLTPTQAAKAYAIRNFGPFWVVMPKASQRQLLAAFLAGYRCGVRRNGK